MKEIPVTEQRNPASYQIDTKSTAEILTIINNEDKKVPEAVAQAIPQLTRLVDCAVEVFQKGGRLFYLGAGTSGHLRRVPRYGAGLYRRRGCRAPPVYRRCRG